MLIYFKVGNFLSYAEPQTISFEAAKISSKHKELDKHNLFSIENKQAESKNLLKSITLYGANGSGKSSIIQAIRFLSILVLKSGKAPSPGIIEDGRLPFLLSDAYVHKPSLLEIGFHYEGVSYQFGCKVGTDHIQEEWLFARPKKKMIQFYRRHADGTIETNSKHFGSISKSEVKKLQSHQLLISMIDEQKHPIAATIKDYFASKLVIATDHSTAYRLDKAFTMRLYTKDKYNDYKNKILKFLQDFGTNINSLAKVKVSDGELALGDQAPDQKETRNTINYNQVAVRQSDIENQVKELVVSSRPQLNASGKKVRDIYLNVDAQESEGTKKLIAYSGLIVYLLSRGGTLIIDQLDAHLHPLIVQRIIQLFNNPQVNTNNAQLLFTTHDVSPLRAKYLRRDQIWFVEKDPKSGSSSTYPLSQLKGVRNDASYGKDYLKGKYGAIPVFGGLDFMED